MLSNRKLGYCSTGSLVIVCFLPFKYTGEANLSIVILSFVFAFVQCLLAEKIRERPGSKV
jgi:uncharacterized membrane protein YagU involved in acid resistance